MDTAVRLPGVTGELGWNYILQEYMNYISVTLYRSNMHGIVNRESSALKCHIFTSLLFGLSVLALNKRKKSVSIVNYASSSDLSNMV